MQRLLGTVGVCVLSLLVAAGCAGGEEDPVLVPATMAPTTIAPTTIAPTTIAPTTIAPTTIAPTTIAPTTTSAASITTTSATPTTSEPAAVEPQSVLVEVGDSLSKIAKRHDTTTEVLAAVNGICDIDQIYPGQKILLVDAGTETDDEVELEPISVTVIVEVGDSLSKIAKQYDTNVNDLMTANEISDPNLLYPGQELVVSGIVPVVPDVEPPVC